MRPIRVAYAGLLLVLAALWLLTAGLAGLAPGWLAWRPPLIQLTGILAVGLMSVGLLLAARPVWLETLLGGLDKMYRLHKWLGISVLVLAIVHWVITQTPKWLIGLGWIERPVRGPRVPPQGAVFEQIHAWRDTAEGLGEWAFYALVLLVVLALTRRLPYQNFFKTHRLMPLIFVVLAFHAVVLLDDASWSAPVGWVLLSLLGAGCVAAVAVFFGLAGRSRQAVAEIESVTLHAKLHVLEINLQLKSRWTGHQPGQFAFVSFDRKEGPHPFTVSSAWTGDGRLGFLVKELGDYTRTLATRLKPGDLVQLEGPYGRFSFASAKPRQVWVGGGIGITPFIAGLLERARRPDGRPVDLFHSTSESDEPAFTRLRNAADKAGVRLHLMVDTRDGRLDAAGLAAAVPDWLRGDVWFCGPAGFGKSLRHDLMRRGLLGRDFHQELFNLR